MLPPEINKMSLAIYMSYNRCKRGGVWDPHHPVKWKG